MHNTKLKSLDVSKNTKLKTLICSNTKISKLNIKKCTKLNYIDITNTKIKKLNVSQTLETATIRCSMKIGSSIKVANYVGKEYVRYENESPTRLKAFKFDKKKGTLKLTKNAKKSGEYHIWFYKKKGRKNRRFYIVAK